MAILIGHASIDENGKISGGTTGDQTGKEVCTRGWYNSGWQTVLRCKDSEKVEEMARACEAACLNPNIGYDQGQRNTLRKQAQAAGYDLSKVGKCECDCSSLMTVCAECADIEIPYTNNSAPSTRTMVAAFKSTGKFDVLTEAKYLTSDKYLRRGDILVKNGHTAMALQDGEYGREQLVSIKVPKLSKGCKIESVRALQAVLNASGFDCGAVDGSFGSKTDKAVKAFQKTAFPNNEKEWDGVVGPATWTALLN